MKVEFYSSIEEIGRQTWQRLCGTHYPFLRYEFLHALETAIDSKTVGEDSKETKPLPACCRETGWQPQHILVFDKDQAIAAMPMYLKYHSYGEYIFDWAWADGYHRNGFNYYPKLLSAIPYSPVTGDRIGLAQLTDQQSYADTISAITNALKNRCNAGDASSFHLLFPTETIANHFSEQGVSIRKSCQYHWFNQTPQQKPYQNFAEFLACCRSRKRKDLKKEREAIDTQDILLTRLVGADIDGNSWEEFYYFYQTTYAKRSGHGGYLPKAFFKTLAQTMPEQLMMVVAKQNGKVIAAALNLFSATTLFGRYWGCSEDAEFLHFEACYYQGIEFCIERGLEKFDAGAQGEHKIQRGFQPITTWSNHWIEHTGFRDAIDNYLEEEAKSIQQHQTAAKRLLPFHRKSE